MSSNPLGERGGFSDSHTQKPSFGRSSRLTAYRKYCCSPLIYRKSLSHEIHFGLRHIAASRIGPEKGALKNAIKESFPHRFAVFCERVTSLGGGRRVGEAGRSISSTLPRGFTLVELLVVIAILAVLAALLLPAISGMTAKANLVKCASNLRQITAATLLNANDNNGMFPALQVFDFDSAGWIAPVSATNSPGSPTPSPWGVALAPYLGFPPVNSAKVSSPDQIPAIFKCPAAAKNAAENLANSWINTFPSYRYNSYAAGRSAAAAVSLSRSMLWIDAVWPGWPQNTFAHQNPAGINVAYLDGHVAFMPYSAYKEVNPNTDYQDDLYQLGWFK